MVWLRPIRSVCIREDSDSDPIGGFGLRFGEDHHSNALNAIPLVFSVNKKLYTQTLVGADLHHFIIHRPAFWQPRRIHHNTDRYYNGMIKVND